MVLKAVQSWFASEVVTRDLDAFHRPTQNSSVSVAARSAPEFVHMCSDCRRFDIGASAFEKVEAMSVLDTGRRSSSGDIVEHCC